MNRLLKKGLSLILIGTLSFSFLTACKDNNEEGKLNEVEIEEEDNSVTHEASKKDELFTLLEEPFGYDYKTIKNERADMQFQYPSDWDATIHNARHIEINPNKDDNNFSTLTLHILYKYNMGDDSVKEFVANYDQYFEDDIIGLNYKIDNRNDYHESTYVTPTTQETDNSYTTDPNRISLGIRDNIYISNDLGYAPEGEYTGLYYSVYWDHYPCVITTVCKTSELEKAKKMLHYMVSSISHVEKNTTKIDATYTYEDMTITLPDSFKQNEENPNIFTASEKELSKYAGMNVGLFEIDENVDDIEFAFNYAPVAARTFMNNRSGKDQNGYAPNTKTTPISIGGKEGKEFLSTCTIRMGNPANGEFYANGDTYFLHNIMLNAENGKQKVLTIWYLDGQVFTEHELFKEIKSKIRFN